jgi:uncharacterized protein YyaL (SSP411 family)
MPTNRLAQEKSPYLLQHAHNPVDWFPWGEEAFAKARAEEKPIFLSVGYSTCHWCHVMERESFESEEIAALLNELFVPIKVDREERPDVDRIYMMFVQATTGGGGWPMSVWLTPDLKPFYGGTYFPPDNRYGRPGFAFVLSQIANAWKTQRESLVASSAQIIASLAEHTRLEGGASRLDPASLESCFAFFRRSYDSRNGGFGDAPKFPRPSCFQFLLRYWLRSGNEEAREMTIDSLRKMACGGIHDHLGGGFHRYSVDERWHVPHFEKMLYDQAQLAIAYTEAYQISHDESFALVAQFILEYVHRDLTHPEGGFFSAEDADSVIDPAKPHEKGEGAFYIWTDDEIDQRLGAPLAEWFSFRYGCVEDGNVAPANDPHGEFTGRNILYFANTMDQTAARFHVEPALMRAALEDAKAKLLAARNARPRPLLDDKVLVSWNGLMISAFARAAQVLEEHAPQAAGRYRDVAARAARFILKNLFDARTGNLRRRYREGEAAVDAFLDDYAFLAQGLIDLYETDFDTAWLEFAVQLTRRQIELFEDREHGAFFNTSAGSADLLLRVKEDYDGAEPSGNSIAVLNLLRLAQYTGNSEFQAAAHSALQAFAGRINQQSPTIPQMMASWMYELAPKAQVIIAGEPDAPETRRFLCALRSQYQPHTAVIVLGKESREAITRWLPLTSSMTTINGKPAAYVCKNFTCQLPTTEEAVFVELLKS